MSQIDVLVVGVKSGRGHAMIRAIRESPLCGTIYASGVNAGVAEIAEVIPIKETDAASLAQFARKKGIDIVVPTSEDLLAAGIVDECQKLGVPVFGPTRAAAQIEASKVFAKTICDMEGVQIASYLAFYNLAEAQRRLEQEGFPVVIKADGLARGKGASICRSMTEAMQVLENLMSKRVLGNAGERVIIEEFLDGPEMSLHAFCDQSGNFSMCPPSRDHKELHPGGPMTGGMGVITPVPGFEIEFGSGIVKNILLGMRENRTPFSGLLYPGTIMHNNGLHVLEVNARPGDPEMQTLLRLLETDLLEILLACTKPDGLKNLKIKWRKGFAVCIVLASEGYPGKYEKGLPITGIEAAEKMDGVRVFHAGTVRDNDGVLRTDGGRVLSVTATGNTPAAALNFAYAAADIIRFQGKRLRRDIGAGL